MRLLLTSIIWVTYSYPTKLDMTLYRKLAAWALRTWTHKAYNCSLIPTALSTHPKVNKSPGRCLTVLASFKILLFLMRCLRRLVGFTKAREFSNSKEPELTFLFCYLKNTHKFTIRTLWKSIRSFLSKEETMSRTLRQQ